MTSTTQLALSVFISVGFASGAACGGSVVVDGSGAGGSGGGTSSSTSTSTTTSTTTTSCDALLADLSAKVAAAQACDPLINSVQCDGSAVVLDACSCQLLANETNPTAVAAAQAAYQAASACFPTCDGPCVGIGPGFCQPVPNGGGVCVSAVF